MDHNLYVALANRASDLVVAGDHEGAIAVLEQLVDSDLPTFDKGVTWLNIATIRHKMGQPDLALVSYAHALDYERVTDSYFIAQQHAAYLSQLGMYEESIAAYRALVERTDVKSEDAAIFRANIATLEKLARQ